MSEGHTPPTEAELDEWKSLCETFLADHQAFYMALRAKDAWFQIRLVDTVRRLRALRDYLFADGIVTADEDGNLLFVRRLAADGFAWEEGECGITQAEANELNGLGGIDGTGLIKGAEALTRILDAARQEPSHN